MINVRDVESSSRWYQKLLGCTSGHGGPHFEMLMDGETLVLMLHTSSEHDHPSAAPHGSTVGAGVSVYVRVEDLAAAAQRASQMSIPLTGLRHNDLAHQDELALRDPDGYFLVLCGPTSWGDDG